MNGTTKNYIYFPTPGGATVVVPSSGGQYFMHKDWAPDIIPNQDTHFVRAT